MAVNVQQVVDKNKAFQDDYDYIKNEVIARQVDGTLCKWSRIIREVVIIGLPDYKYREYWENKYKNVPEYLPRILEAVDDLLENHLISAEKMIELIRKSNDFETEKKKAIEALGGKYKNGKLVR